LIKSIKILKKLTASVRFRFYKPETEKTEPNPYKKTRKKPSQTKKTESNQFEPVSVLKNQTEPNRNRSVWTGFSFFILKNSVWLFFLNKNRTEPNRKWSPLILSMLWKIKISWIYYYCDVLANSKKNLKKEEETLLISHGCFTVALFSLRNFLN